MFPIDLTVVPREGMRLGLIGDPVAHSISPAIQGAALAALGLDATYELWQTPAAELPARVASLRAPDVLGANVTVPHKLAVMDHLDEVTPLARRAGAVNTIVNRGGRLAGDNTDVHGFATSLVAACPNAGVRPALVLGAGGAARAVVLALEAMGVTRITVANRSPERAERLAADLAPTPLRLVAADEPTLRRELVRAALLVNATTLGWHPGETPLPLDLLAVLAPNCFVVDLTYRDTDMLVAARERGLRTLDGLPMLVHQGARALELWTGRGAPLQIMLDAATTARDARSAPRTDHSEASGGAREET
jgi:shikimate dehydrogenase